MERTEAKPSQKQARPTEKKSPRGPRGPEPRGPEHVCTVPFGESLEVKRYRLANGLTILVLRDPSAPVVSYQTWLRVGSRHEERGKTGQAHLLEHLMFNGTKARPQGVFDRLLEAAGGETNAATWCDWTSYYENVPASELALVVELEADRMANLALDRAQVASEKEVVVSERRDRVEDDVEGTMSELLYATAFGRTHPYGWPTIGWMKDIASFTPSDCRAFYRRHYAPDAATLVVAGDVDEAELLALVQRHYGSLRPSGVGPAPVPRLAAQDAERRRSIRWPTPTQKLAAAWHAPGFAHFDHAVLVVISQLLTGGRSSRLHRELVRERELATEVRMSIAPFEHGTLVDLFVSAREGKTAEQSLRLTERALARLGKELAPEAELSKVKARLELGFLGAMETASGKADQIGFSEAVTRDPAHSFVRLAEYRRVTPQDVRRVAREIFVDHRRTLVLAEPTAARGRAKKKAAS